jgi:peptidoglycan-associated lipoprotein
MRLRLYSISSLIAVSLIVSVGACRRRAPVASAPAPPQQPETRVVEVPEAPAGPVMAAVPAPLPLPPPAEPRRLPPPRSLGERLSSEVQDAYFDFDKFHIRDDAALALVRDAEALKIIFDDFPDTTVVLEGHCDERGSAEYNLALGDRRASAAREYLEHLGVPVHRLITVSYGKERPQCTEATEECWQNNRRVHFVPGETQRRAGPDPEN